LLLVLLLIFFVLRPTMKRLTTISRIDAKVGEEANAAATGTDGTAGAAALQAQGGDQLQLPGPGRYENSLDAARGLVQNDPKRVAQVVRSWVAEDAG
jgi:flagellar M-ring protein FliF